MISAGGYLVSAAVIICFFSFGSAVTALKNGSSRWTSVSRRALFVSAVFAWAALFELTRAFLYHDFDLLYVWQNSTRQTPWFYRISAVWGGMSGSLLLWAAFSMLFSALVMRKARADRPRFEAGLSAVFSGANLFFLIVVLFWTNPFRVIPLEAMGTVNDGRGLNPLLENPSMLIHPPLLYAGFTGFIAPFAICLAALIEGDRSDHWVGALGRFSLIAWLFLTAGIILGGNWAYIELGWGGFWGWDPVENASFMPWLTGTALVHTVMVQERRGILQRWNCMLAVITFLLCVFGTFLTRSGLVQSVHAFAEGNIGWLFMSFLALTAVVSFALILFRGAKLASGRSISSLLSRETIFLINTVVFLCLCLTVFWGVMLPVFSEVVFGSKQTVGPPYFNRAATPLFLILLLSLGAAPLFAWKRTSPERLGRQFIAPFVAGLAAAALSFALSPSHLYAAVAFGVIAFAAAATFIEIGRGVHVRRELSGESRIKALFGVIGKKPRRFGGLVVHLGALLAALAITASMAFKIEQDLVLTQGQEAPVGHYRVRLDRISEGQEQNYRKLSADLSVFDARDGSLISTAHPEKRAYNGREEVTSEVDIRMRPLEDLYFAFAGFDQKNNSVVLKVFVNPLQLWLWVGSFIMLFGMVLVFRGLPRAKARRS